MPGSRLLEALGSGDGDRTRSGVGMDTTAKTFLSLFLLIVGGLFVMTGAPVFHVLPTDLANAFALACVLFAIIVLVFVPAKR